MLRCRITEAPALRPRERSLGTPRRLERTWRDQADERSALTHLSRRPLGARLYFFTEFSTYSITSLRFSWTAAPVLPDQARDARRGNRP